MNRKNECLNVKAKREREINPPSPAPPPPHRYWRQDKSNKRVKNEPKVHKNSSGKNSLKYDAVRANAEGPKEATAILEAVINRVIKEQSGGGVSMWVETRLLAAVKKELGRIHDSRELFEDESVGSMSVKLKAEIFPLQGRKVAEEMDEHAVKAAKLSKEEREGEKRRQRDVTGVNDLQHARLVALNVLEKWMALRRSK